MWVLCNSLFSKTTAPQARQILPASHRRLNLSPIRKASFPPSGQVQGPQAARWLHSLRVSQTAGKPNPLLPPGDLASSPRRCAGWPRPHRPARPTVSLAGAGRPPLARIPRLARPGPGPAPNACRPPARSGRRGRQSGPAPPCPLGPAGGRAGGRGAPLGTPRGSPAKGAGSGPGSGAAPPARLPAQNGAGGAPPRGGPTVPRRPLLGLGPGPRRRRAGGGLARVPPLLGPAHKEPRRGPAPAPRRGPQRERPRRRRPGPSPGPGPGPGREGGREGG